MALGRPVYQWDRFADQLTRFVDSKIYNASALLIASGIALAKVEINIALIRLNALAPASRFSMYKTKTMLRPAPSHPSSSVLEDVDPLGNALEAKQNEITALEAKISELHSEIEKKRSQLRRLNESEQYVKIEAKRVEWRRLNEDLKHAKGRDEEWLKSTMTMLSQEIKDDCARIARWEADIRAQIARCDADIARCDADIARCDADIAYLRSAQAFAPAKKRKSTLLCLVHLIRLCNRTNDTADKSGPSPLPCAASSSRAAAAV